ncbi:MAG: hypothetical protein K0Q89_762 [Thermomicrobiales bacterium]|jgi:hypothetical protein|nr:hypothetical protein [Thermomicrobiales bacterium]
MDDLSHEHRKHIFAINGRELFQEENSDVGTNFLPNSSA